MEHKIMENLKYTLDHEWAKIENETLTFGITDFAQSSLGDIVFVELPEIGTTVEKGTSCGVIESIKSVNDIFPPTSGEILDVNQDVIDSPENLNNDAYDSWLVKIKLSNVEQIDELLNSQEYLEHCKKNS
ncbi:MAG: glycine cleavage system protein GcvH [Bacteriovoracaceae bacterium]|nr:glycine cleavage system protein GcvH [Bacteriovoracaceae bacterium]